MKKIAQKITKKKIFYAIIIGILLWFFVIGKFENFFVTGERWLRYFYFSEVRFDWYEMLGKCDYGYTVCVYTSQKLRINNGKKERVLQPLEYYDGMDNCIWEYNREITSDYDSYYSIFVMEGDELSVTGEETFEITCRSTTFPEDYTVYDCIDVHICETRDFHFRVEKERIRFWSEENLGNKIYISLYPRTLKEKEFWMYHDFGQVVYAVEIRKGEEGLPVTYVDLDGDGYCEFNCEEYGEWKIFGEFLESYLKHSNSAVFG